MMFRLFVSLLVLGLLVAPGFVLALTITNPSNGAIGVDYGRSSYFQWEEVSGTSHYELIIAGVVQRADNIEPTACSGGICSLWFLDPARPVTIQCFEKAGGSYSWRVEAYDASNALIDSSPSFASFSTEQCPGPSSGGPGGRDGGDPVITPSDLNPISSQTLPELLENVLNFLFGLSIVILPIIILYGGILLLTAGGDPQKISRSRTILLWAVVAFAIILLARGLPPVLRGLL